MAIRASPYDEWQDRLPPQVKALAWREREIASIIYLHGALTSRELGDRLSPPISNGAVRSMLVRLLRKGVLKRRPTGQGKEFKYVGAIETDDLKEQALRQLACDYFGGSLLRAASAIVDLLQSEGDSRAVLQAELESISDNRMYEHAQVHLAA